MLHVENDDVTEVECMEVKDVVEIESNVPLYFSSDEEAYAFIDAEEVRTCTKFVSSKSRSLGGLDTLCGKTIFWSDNDIPFDGVPFVVLGSEEKDCQHGPPKRPGPKQNQGIRRRIKQGLKQNCPAKIKIRRIIKFPTMKLTGRNSRRRRYRTADRLRELYPNIMKEYRVYMEFPSVNEHVTHPVGEFAESFQKIDRRIVNKIHELVKEGVKNVEEMKRHIGIYVKNEILPIYGEVSPTNRRFYPSNRDYRNHMYRAKKEKSCRKPIQLAKCPMGEHTQFATMSSMKSPKTPPSCFHTYVSSGDQAHRNKMVIEVLESASTELVNLTVRVFSVLTDYQEVPVEEGMKIMRKILVADNTSCISIALSEDLKEEVVAGRSYHFTNLSNKDMSGIRFLTTTPGTLIQEILKVESDIRSLLNRVTGKFTGVQVVRAARCGICYGVIPDIGGPEKPSIKCGSCGMRILASDIRHHLKCYFSIRMDKTMLELSMEEGIFTALLKKIGCSAEDTDIIEESVLLCGEVSLLYHQSHVVEIKMLS